MEFGRFNRLSIGRGTRRGGHLWRGLVKAGVSSVGLSGDRSTEGAKRRSGLPAPLAEVSARAGLSGLCEASCYFARLHMTWWAK
jgi:hypothetical protein